MRFFPNRLAKAVGSAAVLALAAGFAPAQAQEAQQPPAAAELDDATLRAFAEASLEVEEVMVAWAPRIEEAEGTEQAEELREAANQELIAAVQSSGLDVESYNQIYGLAQADPQVASQVQRHREELQ